MMIKSNYLQMQSTLHYFQQEGIAIDQRLHTLRSVMPAMPSPNNHIVTRDTKENLHLPSAPQIMSKPASPTMPDLTEP